MYTIGFNDTRIDIETSVYSGNNTTVIKRTYHQSIIGDIWYPLIEGFINGKSKDSSDNCMCIADLSFQMIDSQGKVIVDGTYNDHKFEVDIEGTFVRILQMESDKDIELGYNNLKYLCGIFKKDIEK